MFYLWTNVVYEVYRSGAFVVCEAGCVYDAGSESHSRVAIQVKCKLYVANIALGAPHIVSDHDVIDVPYLGYLRVMS